MEGSKSWLRCQFDKLLKEQKFSNFEAVSLAPLQEVEDLKRELDTLLVKWKPPSFNQMNRGVGMYAARVG